MTAPGRRYAEDTHVSSERSRAELERLLTRYGAGGFAYGWDEHGAQVAFLLRGWHVRLYVPMPDPDSPEFTTTATGKRRSPTAAAEAAVTAQRARWRQVVLIVKAKLEAVANGVVTFEQEWMAHMVLPDGRTLSEAVTPQLEAARTTGQLPALLPGRPA